MVHKDAEAVYEEKYKRKWVPQSNDEFICSIIIDKLDEIGSDLISACDLADRLVKYVNDYGVDVEKLDKEFLARLAAFVIAEDITADNIEDFDIDMLR